MWSTKNCSMMEGSLAILHTISHYQSVARNWQLHTLHIAVPNCLWNFVQGFCGSKEQPQDHHHYECWHKNNNHSQKMILAQAARKGDVMEEIIRLHHRKPTMNKQILNFLFLPRDHLRWCQLVHPIHLNHWWITTPHRCHWEFCSS